MNPTEMIKEFQCPGCVCGNDPATCKAHKVESEFGYYQCTGHVLGTSVFPIGFHVALGLPTGFNRAGDGYGEEPRNKMLIRLWPRGVKLTYPDWDRCNVAVWAMEKDGFLFTRTYMPRTNRTAVDVIEGGTLALAPNAIDVGKFHDEID